MKGRYKLVAISAGHTNHVAIIRHELRLSLVSSPLD